MRNLVAMRPAPKAVSRRRAAPLRVGVLVDLTLSPDAGGHVKCWQRLAEAAIDYPDQLDLTVHFSGPEARRIELSPTVRYVVLPPVLGTGRFVDDVPDHTDLAPWHPRLTRLLSGYDVIHTTDAFFCYARTAARFARRSGTPIVSSIHTNTPEYARLTCADLLARRLGRGAAYRLVRERLRLPERVEGLLRRRLDRHLNQVTLAMASYGLPDAGVGERHCGVVLRRGVDRATFAPERRDRAWFEARFGLPPGHFVAIYAGKLTLGKNVKLLVPAIIAARQSGRRIHLFCAGEGELRGHLAAGLGDAVTLPGVLAQAELARACASADLFLFPSTIDESGNAAVEALASGLPALLASGSGVAVRMAGSRGVRVLPGDRSEPWAAAIAELAARPQYCRMLGRLAHTDAIAAVPSWCQVLGEDLLPVWQEAAARGGR